jgi:hypothetical protein
MIFNKRHSRFNNSMANDKNKKQKLKKKQINPG